MAGGGATAVKVAVTVGLDETPEALKVMMQERLPATTFAALTEAVTVAGVEPDVGVKVNHAQSEPSEVENANPLAGLVLLTAIVCATGTVPPIV